LGILRGAKKYVDFIIGIKGDGEEILYTCNPGKLSNFFGANPGAPNYLIPVYFRKEVLDKYYRQPSKFSIEDSYLRCGSLWGLQIDNHHPDKVCVWLGDLGRDLPYSEQLYWRSFNIPPSGCISSTYYNRQILAEFTDSDRPEHIFFSLYTKLMQLSQDILGWNLLLPLTKEDEYHLHSIRIPSTDEQKDFDELILALTKIFVDSLNERELNHFLSQDEVNEIVGSISRLEKILAKKNVGVYQPHIKFLRNLQNYRSAGSAHRKGKNYKKIAKELNIPNSSLPVVFEGILNKSNDFLRFLIDCINNGVFFRD